MFFWLWLLVFALKDVTLNTVKFSHFDILMPNNIFNNCLPLDSSSRVRICAICNATQSGIGSVQHCHCWTVGTRCTTLSLLNRWHAGLALGPQYDVTNWFFVTIKVSTMRRFHESVLICALLVAKSSAACTLRLLLTSECNLRRFHEAV